MHLPTGTLPLNPTPSGSTHTYRPRYPRRAPRRYQRAASWSVAPAWAAESGCRCSVTAVASSCVCMWAVSGGRCGGAAAVTGWTKAAKAGSPGGDFVVARASWGLWEADVVPKRCNLQSQGIVGRLWGVYGAWIELNLALQWQKPGGRRRQMQAAPGVNLWWPEPAGGSGRPMFSPKA